MNGDEAHSTNAGRLWGIGFVVLCVAAVVALIRGDYPVGFRVLGDLLLGTVVVVMVTSARGYHH